MKAIQFEGCNIIIAEHQAEYQPIPAKVELVPIAPKPGGCPICGARATLAPCNTPRNAFACGSHSYDAAAGTIMQAEDCVQPTAERVTFCMELTPEEIAGIQRTGLIWHSVLTFGLPLQPQSMTVDKPAGIP